MGDRANVVILNSHHPQYGAVYLYAHWGGESLPCVVEDALKKYPGRWGDESYLARIVFDTMTADMQGEETGFGITATLYDTEHPLIVLDCGQKKLFVMSEAENGRIFENCKDWASGIPFAEVTVDRIMGAGYE